MKELNDWEQVAKIQQATYREITHRFCLRIDQLEQTLQDLINIHSKPECLIVEKAKKLLKE